MALLRRVLLVSNPASRRGARFHAHAIAAFRAVGAECDAVLTEAPPLLGQLGLEEGGELPVEFVRLGESIAVHGLEFTPAAESRSANLCRARLNRMWTAEEATPKISAIAAVS